MFSVDLALTLGSDFWVVGISPYVFMFTSHRRLIWYHNVVVGSRGSVPVFLHADHLTCVCWLQILRIDSVKLGLNIWGRFWLSKTETRLHGSRASFRKSRWPFMSDSSIFFVCTVAWSTLGDHWTTQVRLGELGFRERWILFLVGGTRVAIISSSMVVSLAVTFSISITSVISKIVAVSVAWVTTTKWGLAGVAAAVTAVVVTWTTVVSP